MSTVKANSYYDASGGSNAQLYGVASPPNSMGFRNRLINSDMRIDQRNAGASVTQTTATVYTIDRWWCFGNAASKFTVQRSTTAPAGFTNSLLCTSSSAYTPTATQEFDIAQYIEGFNVADLGWGAAGAQTVTLSFQVRSSLTGTFGGQIANGTSARSYPFSYTISAANTWETKTVTIPGDTTGTWATDNSAAMLVLFSLGAGSSKSGTANTWQAGNYTQPTGATSVVGTNGATFYITGVQLEAGTVASQFERRDYGRELMMCQRYCYSITAETGQTPIIGMGLWNSGTDVRIYVPMKVTMRTTPTTSLSSASHFQALYASVAWRAISSVASVTESGVNGVSLLLNTSGSGSQGQGTELTTASSSALMLFTAEL